VNFFRSHAQTDVSVPVRRILGGRRFNLVSLFSLIDRYYQAGLDWRRKLLRNPPRTAVAFCTIVVGCPFYQSHFDCRAAYREGVR
jgi:hypothetical protein